MTILDIPVLLVHVLRQTFSWSIGAFLYILSRVCIYSAVCCAVVWRHKERMYIIRDEAQKGFIVGLRIIRSEEGRCRL